MMKRFTTHAIKKEYAAGLGSLALIIAVTLLLITGSGVNEQTDGFINTGPFQVAVTLDENTPQVGQNNVHIQVRDPSGDTLGETTVRAVLEAANDSIIETPLIKVPVTQMKNGAYHATLNIPSAGDWLLALDVGTDTSHHTDLVYTLSTGQPGLHLRDSTPVGEVAYYTCAMHPSVRASAPGACPICSMDLIAVTHDSLQSGVITVSNALRQSIGVTTGSVQSRRFTLPVRLQGEITYDPTRLSDISLRFDGWIGDLNADYVGRAIKRGDILFTVYSPELLSLQEEYLESLKRRRTQDSVVNAARKRLRLWGLDDGQIDWLEEQGKAQDYLPIFAPHNGVVIDKNIVNGSSFKKGERLLRLADLSQVWIEAFAYEKDLPLVHAGMAATVRIPNGSGQTYAGELMQVNPFLNGMSRAAHVRLALANPERALSPGAYAEVIVHADLGEQLVVPKEAVLISGDKRIVFLDLGEGQLKPQNIVTGPSDGQYTVVHEGLSQGQSIVTSGNFLIASESKLKTGGDQW